MAEKPKPQKSAAALMADFIQKEAEFSVPLKNGNTIRFRYPADAAEFYRIPIAANRFVKMLEDRPNPDWKSFLPLPPTVAVMAWWVKSLAIEPAFSERDVLQMAAQCGPLLNFLYTAIQHKVGSHIADAAEEEITETGEG